jgi:hypothetical protein
MGDDAAPTYRGSYASPSGEATAAFDGTPPLALVLSDRMRSIAWLIALLAIALLVQIVAGAYRTELGNTSDEPAHFMNALLLRDYLTHGLSQNPLAFAEQYYLSYPKIAPLMWPPFFHATLGLFLLPGWPPHQAALVFVALLAALTAYRLSRFVSLFSSPVAATLMPALFLLVPTIVDLTTVVMVDIALAALGLEAAWWLARFVVSQERRHAILFGVFGACCCLTKGNGVAITLLPAMLMLATGRITLLRSRGIYLAAAMVAVFGAPFLYVSYRLCYAMGDFSGTGGSDTLSRLSLFIVFLWHQLTPIPSVLAVVGAAGAVYRAWTWPQALRTVAPAALVALAVAAILFHTVLPLQYYSGRYVAMAVAPLLGLVPLGAAMVVRAAGLRGPRTAVVHTLLVIATLALFLTRPAVAMRRPLGFAELVDELSRDGLAGRRVLVISDDPGEGALVTEVAMRTAAPVPTVIRGSKLLADGDWMDNNLTMLFGTVPETLQQFEDLHVDYVVFDTSPEAREMPYWSHVRDVTAIAGPRMVAIHSTHASPETGPTRTITVYRVTNHTPGPPKKMRVNLRYSLGKFLEK